MTEFKNKDFTRRGKQRSSSFYVDRFFSMRCSADLMALAVFPNAKEMTESFAAFEATKHIPMPWDKPGAVVVVGDGHTPRTAATFAFRTMWDCRSVDPVLRMNNRFDDVKRLQLYPSEIEELHLVFEVPTLICMVHSHADLRETLNHIFAPKRHVISIPCCKPHNLDTFPDFHFIDDRIWSPKNEVKVWLNV